MPYRVLIEALSPLVFPARKPGTQYAPSLGYIPGGTLWAALGARLNRTPEARFANALPRRKDDLWTRVVPATAMSCKTHGGWRADAGHGVFDTLIDRVCADELQPAALLYDPHCLVCRARGDRFRGIYARTQDGRTLRRREVQRQILTRVAIDRWRGTAAEEQLYSPIVIAGVTSFAEPDRPTQLESTRFEGVAWDLDAASIDELNTIDRLGGRTSSGLGHVSIEIQSVTESDLLEERLDHFNATFAARWKLWQRLRPQVTPDWTPDTWRVFSIGLQGDAILHEHGWQPTSIFSAAQLAEHTGLDAVLVRAATTPQVAGGWNVRWNLPKPTALAAAMGSVFLFRTRASRAEVLQALRHLEERGIGSRRHEGYGVVRCCDEFHTMATGEVL